MPLRVPFGPKRVPVAVSPYAPTMLALVQPLASLTPARTDMSASAATRSDGRTAAHLGRPGVCLTFHIHELLLPVVNADASARVGHRLRRRDLKPADLVGVLLGEPQRAIRAGHDVVGHVLGCWHREALDRRVE